MHKLDAGKSAFLTGVYTLALSLAMGHAASATPVLDQSYAPPLLLGAEQASNYDFQQGLTVGLAGSLTSIQLFLQNFTGKAENLEVRIANGQAGTVQSSWMSDNVVNVKNNFGGWFTIDRNCSPG
jgi:hypothetical protein